MLPKPTGILWPDADHAAAATVDETAISDWYLNSSSSSTPLNLPLHDFRSFSSHHDFRDLAFSSNPIDSSSSCSPSQDFALHPSQSLIAPHNSCFSSLLNAVSATNFDNGFDFAADAALFGSYQANQAPSSSVFMEFTGVPQIGNQALCLNQSELLPVTDVPSSYGAGFNPTAVFENFDALFENRSKVLRPLEVFPQVGAQPTLFQKRLAHRFGSAVADKREDLEVSGLKLGEGLMWKNNGDEDVEDGSGDVSRLYYDSDEGNEYNKEEDDVDAKNCGSNSNANSTVTGGDQKGKKKGLPAKNLMAERRRRKKLNDRLYMLRSIVPKISKVRIQASALVFILDIS